MKARQLGQTTFERDASRLRVAARTPNQIAYSSQILGKYVKRHVFAREGLADNTATALFTITTTNETGNTDGGAYICWVTGAAMHSATNDTTNSAVRAYRGHFSRAQESTGTGVNSAVVEDSDDAGAATTPATRDIADVIMTVTETSEYVQTINFTVDLNGAGVGTAEVAMEVMLVWWGFLTSPQLAGVNA